MREISFFGGKRVGRKAIKLVHEVARRSKPANHEEFCRIVDEALAKYFAATPPSQRPKHTKAALRGAAKANSRQFRTRSLSGARTVQPISLDPKAPWRNVPKARKARQLSLTKRWLDKTARPPLTDQDFERAASGLGPRRPRSEAQPPVARSANLRDPSWTNHPAGTEVGGDRPSKSGRRTSRAFSAARTALSNPSPSWLLRLIRFMAKAMGSRPHG